MSNIPEDYVKKDLSCYNQDNLYPKSLTVVEGDLWRHYELGSITGFIVWNEIVDGELWIGMAELKEDDCFWAVPKHPLYISAGWAPTIQETYNRMINWLSDYVEFSNIDVKIKKPIINEIVWNKEN